MDMTGEYRIAADREAVWRALNDPEVLKACIPGCETLTATDEGLEATVVAKVGPIKAKFSGKVRFENVDPPNGYSIVGEGQGGVAGFARGGADVALADEGDGTRLTYQVKAQVGGKLAQLGSRLVDGTARSLAEQFFTAFAEKVAPPAAAAEVLPETGGEVIAEKDAALSDVVAVAGAVEKDVEARIEAAAVREGPSGIMLWGMIAALVLIVAIYVMST